MNRKKWLLVFAFIVCAVYCLQNLKWCGMELFSATAEVEDARMAVKTISQDLYIVDKSSSRILMVNEQGEVCNFIQGGGTKDVFCYAVSIQPAKDGGFYLLDYIKSENKAWYVSEVIRKFGPDGKQEEIVYEYEFEEAKRTGITKIILNKDGVIHAVKSDSTGLHLMNLENTEDSVRFDFKNADRMIKDYTIAPRTGTLYFLTERGEIGYFDQEDGESRIIYQSCWEEHPRILSALSFSEQGQLYVTDTWNQEVCMVNDGELELFLTENDYFYDVRVFNGFTVCGMEGIYQTKDGETVYRNSFSLSGGLLLGKILFFAAAAYSILFLTGGLVLVLRYIQQKGTALMRGSAVFLFGILAITTVFSMITMKNVEARFTAEMMLRAQTAADIIAKNIPGGSFLALDSPEAFLTEDYEIVKEAVNKGFMNSYGEMSDMYCVLYSMQDGVVLERFRLEENRGSSYVCPWEGTDEEEILRTKEPMQYERIATSEGVFIFVLVPILDGNGNGCGIIEVGKNIEGFDAENQKLILELFINIIALAAVIFMITLEVLIYLQGHREYLENGKKNGKQKVPVSVWRMIVFLIFFITNIPTGFLAILATRMAEDMEVFGIAPSVLAAVPISAEVFSGAVCSVYGSRIIKRMGQRKAGMMAAVFFVIGLFVRFIFQNLWAMTLGGAIQGCGWGILLLIVNISIAAEEDKNKREDGFTGYSVACQNGVNAGVVFGGFLLYWLDYQKVFLAGTMLGVLVLLFVKVYVTDGKRQEMAQEKAGMPVMKFLLSPRVLLYFLGIVLPIVAAGYYLNYLYPILGSGFGITDTNIGYSYLINGLCIMACGNVLTKQLSKRLGKKQIIILSSALYAGAFLLAAWVQSIPVLLLTMGILGLADSFGGPVQSSYFAELPEVNAYGYDRSVGVLGLVENLAETGGPFLFGYILVAGLKPGLIFMAVMIFGLALLFGLTGCAPKRRK